METDNVEISLKMTQITLKFVHVQITWIVWIVNQPELFLQNQNDVPKFWIFK